MADEHKGLAPDELGKEDSELEAGREALSLLTPGSGGAFGMATAADVAAEPSPTDDVVTIQTEDQATSD